MLGPAAGSSRRGATAARAIALRVLLRVERGAYANAALDQALSNAALSERERGFATALVDGVLRWRGRVDYALAYYLTRPLESLTPAIRSILRLGAFQMLFMGGVPARAACDEAVRMARTRGHVGTAGLVNAVLRRLARTGEPPLPDRAADQAAYLAIALSHPRWLVERWLASFGSAATEALCEADNRPAPLCLRPNCLRTTADDLTRLLATEGMKTEPSPVVPTALRMTSGGDPKRSPSHAAGRFTVQGDGSVLVGLLARPQPGWRVLDMCAGAGGKATHMAELMDNRGHIVAVDRQGWRIEMLKEECKRLGIGIIEACEMDARAIGTDGRYDLCLLDAPCSGTGTLRRRTDSRWRKTPGQIQQLAALQRELLLIAAGTVRPGGIVVYSTCSLEPEENEDVVASACAARVVSGEDCRALVLGIPDTAFTADGRAIRLLPYLHDTDGMFMARLRKEA